ncbi:MAG: uracil-DNA glycosylase [Bacteroidota bacterium]
MTAPIQLEESWKNALNKEFEQDYFKNLIQFLKGEKMQQKLIFPPGNQIFHAFERCPLARVKVVILGQDPYHDLHQAHGLCFSVNDGIALPPSLQNIFKEIESDLGIHPPSSGNLDRWADQGVLLLNAVLTVEAHKAGSHQHKGWEQFTDAVIQQVSQHSNHVVFLLWGNYAKQKSKLIDASKHLILSSGHPSPLSANRGLWFGNKHFSKTNAYLEKYHHQIIQW